MLCFVCFYGKMREIENNNHCRTKLLRFAHLVVFFVLLVLFLLYHRLLLFDVRPPDLERIQIESESKQQNDWNELGRGWMFHLFFCFKKGGDNISKKQVVIIGNKKVHFVFIGGVWGGVPDGRSGRNCVRSGRTWTAWRPCVCGSGESIRQNGRTAIDIPPKSTGTVSHL